MGWAYEIQTATLKNVISDREFGPFNVASDREFSPFNVASDGEFGSIFRLYK